MSKRQIISLATIFISLLALMLFVSANGVKTGDVDKDGKITAEDARVTLRASALLETLDEEQTAAAEVTGDGKITAADARLILRVSAQLDSFTQIPDETEPDSEPVTEEPSTEEPTTEEPSAEEPSTEEPTTEEPSTEEPSTEEPTTEEPSTEEPTTEEPSTEEPSTEEPSTEEPSENPDEQEYPDAVNVFLSGSFYINGSMEKNGKKSDFIIASNGTEIELMPVIDGKTISLFVSADKTYLKWQKDAGAKYCIDIASLPVNTDELNISEMLNSINFAMGQNYIFESVTEKETDGKILNAYTFKNADGREIVFYADGENIEIIEAIKGNTSSKIDVNRLTGDIPESFLTTEGYAQGAVHDFVQYIDGVAL